jgi:hypothetical protein
MLVCTFSSFVVSGFGRTEVRLKANTTYDW